MLKLQASVNIDRALTQPYLPGHDVAAGMAMFVGQVVLKCIDNPALAIAHATDEVLRHNRVLEEMNRLRDPPPERPAGTVIGRPAGPVIGRR